MANADTDPVLFLGGARCEIAQIARGLLEARGILVLLHDSHDALGSSGLGVFGGNGWPGMSFPEVYAPRIAFDDANTILEEALGADWRENPGPSDTAGD